jgi:hypothetical protein
MNDIALLCDYLFLKIRSALNICLFELHVHTDYVFRQTKFNHKANQIHKGGKVGI